MPLFTYSGDDGRYYPDLGLTCNDGDAIELDQAPDDGRFIPAVPASPPAPQSSPAIPATPAADAASTPESE